MSVDGIELDRDVMSEEQDIDVMIVEADKHPYMAQIPNNTENMMEIIGGELNITIWEDKEVALVCDMNAFEKGREPNRMLFDKEGEPYDIICGNFIIAGGVEDGHLTSLSMEQAKECYEEFYGLTFFGVSKDESLTDIKDEKTEDLYKRDESWNEEREFWN